VAVIPKNCESKAARDTECHLKAIQPISVSLDFREGTSAKKMLAFSLRDAREVNRFNASQLKLQVVDFFRNSKFSVRP